jgi:hypothetical protein
MPSLATNSGNVLTITIRDDDGELVAPATIYLVWKLGRNGEETTVTQGSLTNVSTGVYTYTVTPEDDGEYEGENVLLYYEWVTTVPSYVERGKVALSSSLFTYAR